ncbi:MAG: YaiI/YqxD family protein [Clostridiales bacterium]
MRILVDADACPVKKIIISLAKKLNIKVIMFIDTSHNISDGYSEVVMVDKAMDSVDIKLVNSLEKEDVVITQDYGVATMSIAKGAKVINQNGYIIDNNNIERLMFERFLSQKIRRSGNRVKGPKKRSKEDDERFKKEFEKLII